MLISFVIIIGVLLFYFLALYKTLSNGFGSGFDDAYMFFRYAQNLVHHQQLTWNLGESPIYGPTSIPYVYIVAIFILLLPLKSNFLLPFVSWIIGLFVVILLFIIALTQTKKSAPIFSVLAIGCVAWAVTTPFFAYHATTGMDTTLSILVNTMLVFTVTKIEKDLKGKNILLLSLLAYLSYAMRPDNIIYAIGFPLMILLIFGRWREALIFLIVFALFIASDTWGKQIIFQDFLPLSYYVKQNNLYQEYLGAHQWNPSIYLATFITGVLPSSIIILANWETRHFKLFIAYLLPVLATFLYYFKVLQIMGEQARFYYPAMPFIIVLSILLLRDLGESPSKMEFKRIFNKTVFSVLTITAFLLFLGTVGANIYLNYISRTISIQQNESDSNSSIPNIGWGRSIVAVASLSSKLPPDAVLAMSEVGYVGANAPQVKIIDLSGLNNPDIAYNGLNAEKLFSQKPDLIWMPPTDYALLRHEILCTPNFYVNYSYYPNLFDSGIAVYKKSPYTNIIYLLLSKTIDDVYPKFDYSYENLQQDWLPQICK